MTNLFAAYWWVLVMLAAIIFAVTRLRREARVPALAHALAFRRLWRAITLLMILVSASTLYFFVEALRDPTATITFNGAATTAREAKLIAVRMSAVFLALSVLLALLPVTVVDRIAGLRQRMLGIFFGSR